jgi:membrane-associated phospholipid phosphatase
VRNLRSTSDLHLHAPMTVRRVHAAHGWILPVAGMVVAALAVGALGGWLVWDEPVTRWIVDSRTDWWDDFFRRVSFLGSTPVVVVVSLLAAAASWRRCPRLAIAILIVLVARPLAEAALKELVRRDRPVGDGLVPGRGYSFPSGHPLATAASWGMLPLVVALYTRRRAMWWSVAIGVWTLAVLVAVSRVWLGVHWASDVVAGLALAVLGVALVERLILADDCGCAGNSQEAAPIEATDDADPQLPARSSAATSALVPGGSGSPTR